MESAKSNHKYDDILISDLEIMNKAVNYRSWMYRQIAPYVGQRILEIGAGIGNFTTFFAERPLVITSDVFPNCIDYLNERFFGKANIKPMRLDIAKDYVSSIKDQNIDTVICLNVLEHIEDDAAALCRMADVLQPGGRLILLVPSCQFIYGTVDQALGHYRRYNRRSLLWKIAAADVEVEAVFYMNLAGVAGWFLNNRVLKRHAESPQQVVFFDRFVVPVIAAVERVLKPPFGMSLIAIGRKPIRPSSEMSRDVGSSHIPRGVSNGTS